MILVTVSSIEGNGKYKLGGIVAAKVGEELFALYLSSLFAAQVHPGLLRHKTHCSSSGRDLGPVQCAQKPK